METLPAWSSSNDRHQSLAVICSLPKSMLRNAATRVFCVISRSLLAVTAERQEFHASDEQGTWLPGPPGQPRSRYLPTTYAPPRHSGKEAGPLASHSLSVRTGWREFSSTSSTEEPQIPQLDRPYFSAVVTIAGVKPAHADRGSHPRPGEVRHSARRSPTYRFDRPGNASQPHARCAGNDHGCPGSPTFLLWRGRSPTVLRLCGFALDPVAWRWFLRVVKGHSVSIGKCTSDNGVDVHGKRFSMCTAVLPYVAGFVAVPVLPLHRPCRSGDAGGGRERPPF